MSSAAEPWPPQTGAILAPVLPQNRIQTLDILRGWAVFGILLVDIDALHLPQATWTAFDHGVYRFIDLFASSKFWTLLSFLFGLGFSLQLAHADRSGSMWAFRRRLLALLLIGVLQIIILGWGGHFLVRYAVLGFLLLPLSRLPARSLLFVAVLFMLMAWAYSPGVDLVRERRLANPQTRGEAIQAETTRQADRAAFSRERSEARQAGYVRRVAFQAKGFYLGYLRWLVESPLDYLTWLAQLGMLVVGFYVGRRRFLHDVAAHLPLIHRVPLWGFALGFAVTMVRYAVPDLASQPSGTGHLVQLLQRLGDPALAFAYGAALVLIVEKGLWQKPFRLLATAGRMALTNYLLMAALIGGVAPVFGFGVYSGPGYSGTKPTLGVLLAVVIYGALMWLSHWWLARFRFGPVEWLWRSATYWRWQAMRLQRAPLTAGVANAK